MEVYTTFWDIIKNQGIEVPPIQRDYAQGRESEKIEKIRTKFIDSLYKALDEKKALHLDFIYGKIYGIRNAEEHRRNKQAIESLLRSVKDYASSIDLTFNELQVHDISPNKEDLIYLIPLDGQQRLTTLFLLHWYFSKRLNLSDNLNVLKRFKYKTRKSSLSFINLICSDNDLKFNGQLDEEIIELENFSNTWLDDPTVVSMLVVLRALHSRFEDKRDECISDYWKRLADEKTVFFDFLNLKDFNLSDELYVKMNARGKLLSEFENFKAWLFGKIEKEELIEESILEKNKKHFDIEWNDVFWNNKEANLFEIDDAFFNYFKLLYTYDLIRSVNLNGKKFEDSKYSNRISSILKNSSVDFEIDFDGLFFQNIETYFRVLDICSGFNPNDTILVDFYKFYFSNLGTELTWNNLIKNYLLLSYLISKSKKLVDYSGNDWEAISEYYRIINNLFRNTIIDNASLYKSAIIEIDAITHFLEENDFDISKWIESLEYNSNSVFQKHQIDEEVLKSRLLNKSEQWKSLISEAENISYFEGQLNFLFYKCDMSLVKSDYKDYYLNESYFNKFKQVTNRMLSLFNETGINRTGSFSERIFERTLLSKSDYLLNKGGSKCFGRDTGRDVSWKRLFLRDRNKEETNIALKEIFDLNFQNIKESFEQYIISNKEAYSVDNWRKTFIENKELFNYIGNQKYIQKIDNHGWVIIKDNYKTYIGAHYELFSLDFYIKCLHNKLNDFSPFNEIGYYCAPKNNLEDFPSAYLNFKYNDFNYVLEVRYIKNKFNLRFFSRGGAFDDSIKSFLIESKFQQTLDEFILEQNNENDVLERIKNISKKLEAL